MQSDYEYAMSEAREARIQSNLAAAARQEEEYREGLINHEVNHTYVIKVSFYVTTPQGLKKACSIFTSNHRASSKHFQNWARRRVMLVSNFSHFTDKPFSEHSIAVQDFCQ